MAEEKVTSGCMVEGCHNEHHARGYCKHHYSKQYYNERFISPEEKKELPQPCTNKCDAPAVKHGLCESCLRDTVALTIQVPLGIYMSLEVVAKKEWRQIEGQVLSWIEADMAEWEHNEKRR